MPRVLWLLIALLAACGGPPTRSAPAKRRDTGLGCTLVVPGGWTWEQTRADSRHYVSPLDGNDDTFRENLGIRLIDDDAPIDPKTLMEAARMGLPADMKEIGTEETTIGGKPAYKLFVFRSTAFRMYVQYYVSIARGKVYRITGTTPDKTKDRYLPIFDKMVQSMEFE